MPDRRSRKLALAKLLERNLPAKPDPQGETVLPDSAITAAIKKARGEK